MPLTLCCHGKFVTEGNIVTHILLLMERHSVLRWQSSRQRFAVTHKLMILGMHETSVLEKVQFHLQTVDHKG